MNRAALASILVLLCVPASAQEEPKAPKEPASRPAAPAPKTVSNITFTPPADSGWIEEQATSRMRAAQYKVPKVEGDAEDAELVVFYFGGGGGSVQDNLDRWFGQWRQPDGKPSREAAKVEKRELEGSKFVAHEVALSGTYVAETRPGAGERVNKPGYKMLGAIVETSSGSFFLKLVGPEKTIDAQEERFRRLVDSFRPETSAE
jgi:hypothetical protein